MSIYFGNGSGNPMADRRYNMALELAQGGDFTASADLLRQGAELAPNWPPLHFHLGEALRLSGLTAPAQRAFRDYLSLDPEDKMGATVKLSLMGAIAAPPSMPEGYVRALFDQYAPHFEKSLVEKLSYHTPELIAEAVLKTREGGHARILDLGCGTGLAAQQFSGKGYSITGIDLAPGMIDVARSKNIFDELHIGNFDDFFALRKDPFDLILAADVFVYIGALDYLFAQIAAHLNSGGIFAFSVQSLEDGTWSLGEDHRYAHSRSYIEDCANAAGLKILNCEDTDLRLDAGKPIKGMIFVTSSDAAAPR